MIQKFENFINEHKTLPEFKTKTHDPDALLDYLKKNYTTKYTDGLKHFKNCPVSVPAYKTKDGYIQIWFNFDDSCKHTNVFGGDLYRYLGWKDEDAAKQLEKAADDAYDNLTNEFCIWFVDQVIDILGNDSLIQKKED